MDTAASPGRTEENGADLGHQPTVTVGDQQLDVVQAAGTQRAQERRPARLRVAVADHQAEDLAITGGGDSGRDDHGLRGDPVVDPGLAVGGVQKNVGEDGVI
ncbi:hypothetical protein GCM10010431_72570 [Streptomyces kunmingensis]